ncbi:sodium-dependent transporter [Zooshikella sp. RANM57]|uniref:sodium-dependent transporter n=1 Tax=Zooshikella sp. RANM57 TaxID=3425863 RepID=UPI003D6F44A9
MGEVREQFKSRFGFVMSAAGAAVGLGNIWGFPTRAAENGGAAFLLAYVVLIAVLAYPMLVVEITIGRFGRSNPWDSLRMLDRRRISLWLSSLAGLGTILVPTLVMTFYCIVAGWFLCFMLAPIANMFQLTSFAEWLTGFSISRNLVSAAVFYILTIAIVQSGVRNGVEKWSQRLMPALFLLFAALIAYLLTLPGAYQGLAMYLIPDTDKLWDSELLISAMGQAFFSLTIGGGSMMVYGSYLAKKEHIPNMALQVTAIDTSVAFIAGLLILPAMFVAMNHGVQIYGDQGELLSSDTLVFAVLPALFETMGSIGSLLAVAFFLLMTLAALTSSISMLEVPVALIQEKTQQKRSYITWGLGLLALLVSTLIIFNFKQLFGLVIAISTEYMQPLTALITCILGAWLWNRQQVIAELKQGYPELMTGFFWKVWPWYVRVVCPLLIVVVIANTLF